MRSWSLCQCSLSMALYVAEALSSSEFLRAIAASTPRLSRSTPSVSAAACISSNLPSVSARSAPTTTSSVCCVLTELVENGFGGAYPGGSRERRSSTSAGSVMSPTARAIRLLGSLKLGTSMPSLTSCGLPRLRAGVSVLSDNAMDPPLTRLARA